MKIFAGFHAHYPEIKMLIPNRPAGHEMHMQEYKMTFQFVFDPTHLFVGTECGKIILSDYESAKTVKTRSNKKIPGGK